MGAAERFRGQLLHRPPGSAESVVRQLLAVQAQDARSVALALRARTTSAFRGDFVITWLVRGTLHLVLREDVWWLHALCAPRMQAGNRRRLAQLGVSEATAERAVRLIGRALADGPLDRAALAERLAAQDVPVAGQRIVHLLARAAIGGRVLLDVERRFVLAAPPRPPDRDVALRELARRYLAAHAGADERDLARWSGLPASELRLPTAPPPAAPGATPLRLIPAYDELLLGWRDRSPTVPERLAERVHPGGGLLRAVVLEDGVAAGTWGLRDGKVTVDGRIADQEALAREIAEIEAL